MKKDIINETFQKHTFLLKKKLYEQGVIHREPIQEVELEEGLKDIAFAGLLGLSTLFSTATKADNFSGKNTPSATASSGEERAIKTSKLGDIPSADELRARFGIKKTPDATTSSDVKNTSTSNEINNVKSVAKNAEELATEIAKEINSGDDYSKSSAQEILNNIIKFNKDHKFGSAAQMKISIEHAESNSRNTNKGKPNSADELIGSMPDKVSSMIPSDNLNKIKDQADKLSKSQAELLVKKYNVTDGHAEQSLYTTCYYSAIGDFIQMIAQKLVDNATRP